jgi:hypothetical protein
VFARSLKASYATKPQGWGEFVRAFNGIARHRHRYEVFRDFVTLSALGVGTAQGVAGVLAGHADLLAKPPIGPRSACE